MTLRWTTLTCLSVLVAGTAAAVLKAHPQESALVIVNDTILSPNTYVTCDHARRAAPPNAKKKTTSTTVKAGTNAPTTTITTTATAVTTSASTSASSTGAYGSTPKSDCSCGYFMSEYGNAYYPLGILADFASVSTIDALPALGLVVSTGRIGGVNQDDRITSCHSDPANVRLTSDGTLQLVVPGGQSKGGIITGAELHSADTMISGHLSMTTRVSLVHGTCQAMFTYIDEGGYPTAGDEQDIEMLGQSLDKGIVLTNWNPATYHTQNVGAVIPFPSPPTTAFHNYTIFWPPVNASPRQTSYYFDGQLLKTFDQYASVNPSRAYLNNWSNGQVSFTQGPPATDAVLEVSRLAWYYSTMQVPGLPSGCTMQQACKV